MHAEGLVDDGLEVREGAGVGEADVGVGVAGEVGVDLVAELGVDIAVFEEEVEERCHCDATVFGDLVGVQMRTQVAIDVA